MGIKIITLQVSFFSSQAQILVSGMSQLPLSVTPGKLQRCKFHLHICNDSKNEDGKPIASLCIELCGITVKVATLLPRRNFERHGLQIVGSVCYQIAKLFA